MMQYLHTWTCENHLVLVEDNRMITQFENAIPTSTKRLKPPRSKWFGVPKTNTYFHDLYANISL